MWNSFVVVLHEIDFTETFSFQWSLNSYFKQFFFLTREKVKYYPKGQNIKGEKYKIFITIFDETNYSGISHIFKIYKTKSVLI